MLFSALISFGQPKESSVVAKIVPGQLKDGNQTLYVSYTNSKDDCQATITVMGKKYVVDAKKGLNEYIFPVKATKSSRQGKVALSSASGESYNLTFDYKPVGRDWRVGMVQHSHTDIGYTRPQHEILAEHLRYIDFALDYCDQTDHLPKEAQFHWTCEAAWAVAEFLRCRPQKQIDRLVKRVNEGRIEIMAMYFNYDELPDERALAHSLEALKLIRSHGIKVEGAMQNDVNGIGWCFADIFPQLGIKYLTMGTHGHKALICFDHPTVFNWEAPSGEQMLAFRAEHYMQGNFLQVEKGDFKVFEARLLKYLSDLEELGYPMDITSFQFSGYFTDNSAPSTAACAIVDEWNKKYDFPYVKLSQPNDFLKTVEKEYADKVETIRGAWPDWWTDGFASGAREAAVTRYASADITANQVGLSLAAILGAKIPEDEHLKVDEVDQAILFYGEHTFGYHGSIWAPFSYETMEQRSHKAAYAWEAYRRSRSVGETAIGLLQWYTPRDEEHTRVAVFNPLNWSYSGIVTVYINHQIIDPAKEAMLVDKDGNKIAMEPGERHGDATYWQLWVEDVPALGTASYKIVTNDSPAQEAQKIETSGKISNQWYDISLDLDKGILTSIVDKESGKELVDSSAPWHMGELIYETDTLRGALDRKIPGKFERVAPERVTFKGATKGAIWDRYQFSGFSAAGMDLKGKDNFTFDLLVCNKSKEIKMEYVLNKRGETGPESVYVAMPFEMEDGHIVFDVPGGNVRAGEDQIVGSSNDWNTVQNFASVKGASSQIVLVSPEVPLMQFGGINLGRFKAGAKPETTNIYSWPMTNHWVTNFNADQHGEFEWTYNITSSDNTNDQFATEFAWSHRVPMLTRVIPAGEGSAEAIDGESILSLEPSNVLLVDMYPSPGEDAVIVHLREMMGKASDIKVSSKFVTSMSVQPCNVLGEVTGGDATIKPLQTKFFKISWKRK